MLKDCALTGKLHDYVDLMSVDELHLSISSSCVCGNHSMFNIPWYRQYSFREGTSM